jgi:hypothetical protein
MINVAKRVISLKRPLCVARVQVEEKERALKKEI